MLHTIDVDIPMTRLDFKLASQLAMEIAQANHIEKPMIVSWHACRGEAMSPSFEGGDPESWWEKYGEGNYGELEISVGKDYDFVLVESQGYETLDDMPLRDLKDSAGNPFLCYASLLGDSRVPNAMACMPTDEWLCKQT